VCWGYESKTALQDPFPDPFEMNWMVNRLKSVKKSFYGEKSEILDRELHRKSSKRESNYLGKVTGGDSQLGRSFCLRVTLDKAGTRRRRRGSSPVDDRPFRILLWEKGRNFHRKGGMQKIRGLDEFLGQRFERH